QVTGHGKGHIRFRPLFLVRRLLCLLVQLVPVPFRLRRIARVIRGIRLREQFFLDSVLWCLAYLCFAIFTGEVNMAKSEAAKQVKLGSFVGAGLWLFAIVLMVMLMFVLGSL